MPSELQQCAAAFAEALREQANNLVMNGAPTPIARATVYAIRDVAAAVEKAAAKAAAKPVVKPFLPPCQHADCGAPAGINSVLCAPCFAWVRDYKVGCGNCPCAPEGR